MKDFFKTTIIGGILFLLPLAVLLILLSHALRLTLGMVQPLSHGLALDKLGAVAGIGATTLLAALALIVVSFLAGMAARTRYGGRISRWFEDSLVGGMPQYRMFKTMAEGYAQVENTGALKPALANLEGNWRLGYILEPVATGWLAVFLPTAPTPMTGSIVYLPADRVRPLDINMVQATTLVTRLGIGSGEALRGVDLTLPAAPMAAARG
jgi:uncharacterized membrane protein